jgi:hypothetical protein
MVEVTAERWSSLRANRDPHELYVESVGDGEVSSLIGIDPDARLHLLVAVTEEPPSLPPDLQSIQVRVVGDDDRVWLDVSAKAHHEPLFTMIVNTIIRAVHVEGRDPATSVEKTLEDLRAALRPLAPDLGVSEQIGLFGELWVLSNVLLPTLGPRAVHLWSGPANERHDFVGEAAHIEVKTTTRSDQKHEISRLDQLRAPKGKRLLMASIQLERSLGGSETLADLIDEIVAKLGTDGNAIDVLTDRMNKLGWTDELRQTGSLLRFNLRSVHVFEVEWTFPRLPDDYEPPRGVTALRYTIDVSARSSLSVEQVQGIVGGM